jgi:hypothetical protein
MDGTDRPMTIEERFSATNKKLKELESRLKEMESLIKGLQTAIFSDSKRDLSRDDAKPTEKEHYDILHEGLKHMAGIDAKPIDDSDDVNKPPEDVVRKFMMLPDKPTPTDDKYCTCEGDKIITWFDRTMTTDDKGNVLQDMCDRCCTCGKEVKPSYNAETIKAMEDVKEGKNIITIPLDELFDEDCGKEKQPTDEELVEKYSTELFFETFVRYEDLREVVRQLIAEVRRENE